MERNEMRKALRVPALVSLIGTVMMILCVFLPYSTATEDQREWIELNPDRAVFENIDLTAADMKDLSLVKYAYVYVTMSEEIWRDANAGILYAVLVGAVGGGALIAALFALSRKGFWSFLFGAISFGAFQLLNYDFTDRGIIPSDSYDWGLAHDVFPLATTALAIGAVWLFIYKIVLKKRSKQSSLANH